MDVFWFFRFVFIHTGDSCTAWRCSKRKTTVGWLVASQQHWNSNPWQQHQELPLGRPSQTLNVVDFSVWMGAGVFNIVCLLVINSYHVNSCKLINCVHCQPIFSQILYVTLAIIALAPAHQLKLWLRSWSRWSKSDGIEPWDDKSWNIYIWLVYG